MAVITGTGGWDTLWGTPQADIIDGGNGSDTIWGHGGNDIIYGGNGDDRIYGGAGDDTLFGGTGNDRLEGGTGHNILDGGIGNDTFVLGYGTYEISDPEGYDTLETVRSIDLNDYVGSGIDSFVLAAGQRLGARAVGTEADDVISGSGAGVILEGRGGNDILTGSDESSEVFVGGTGRDIMDSGPKDLGPPWYGQHSGADRFDFLSPEESAVGAQRDVIYNFLASDGPGGDQLNLGFMDANANVAGNQAFVLVDGAFTGTAGELRIEFFDSADDALDYTIVSGDVDGDGAADFEIEVHTQFPNRTLTTDYDIIL